jgi:hypothetical protein
VAQDPATRGVLVSTGSRCIAARKCERPLYRGGLREVEMGTRPVAHTTPAEDDVPDSPTRAAAYVRVSTGRQVEQRLSLDAQQELTRTEIARRGWELTEISACLGGVRL